tara:strand:+ start:421 stop:711 length:291 start_codon:yes stop_codon:yes gene_type:complete
MNTEYNIGDYFMAYDPFNKRHNYWQLINIETTKLTLLFIYNEDNSRPLNLRKIITKKNADKNLIKQLTQIFIKNNNLCSYIQKRIIYNDKVISDLN